MYSQSEPKTIQSLFGSIAKRYDLGNKLITLGMHARWNHRLVDGLPKVSHLLDLCAGTGDIAYAFLQKHPHSNVTLLDFSPEMLEIAKVKCGSYQERATFIQGDALNIPFEDHTFDGITVAYGVRNVANPTRCFEEIYRVLKPGGTLGILEGTRPSSAFLRYGHRLYMKTFLPLVGLVAARNKDAYSYLANTIEKFTPPEVLEEMLKSAGFQKTWKKPLLGGATTLLFAKK